MIESRVPAKSRQQLTAMGHDLDVTNQYSTSMGRGQAVLDDTATKIHYGASDQRADGAAEPDAVMSWWCETSAAHWQSRGI